jgi:hypothetical protein
MHYYNIIKQVSPRSKVHTKNLRVGNVTKKSPDIRIQNVPNFTGKIKWRLLHNKLLKCSHKFVFGNTSFMSYSPVTDNSKTPVSVDPSHGRHGHQTSIY